MLFEKEYDFDKSLFTSLYDEKNIIIGAQFLNKNEALKLKNLKK